MQFSSLRVQTGLHISYDIDLARIEADLPRFIGPPVTLVITQQIRRHHACVFWLPEASVLDWGVGGSGDLFIPNVLARSSQ